MSDGFTVRPQELAEGGRSADSLAATGEKIGTGVTSALGGMGEAAGHPGLTAALAEAAEQGIKSFLDLGAAIGHAASGLAASAASYGQAEEENAAKARSIGSGAQ